MSIKGQGHSLTLVKGHSDFKVKRLTFGLYTQVSYSGPQGPLVLICQKVSWKAVKGQGKLGKKSGNFEVNFVAALGVILPLPIWACQMDGDACNCSRM